ncbi:MAG: hypothetical protein ACJ75B_21165 [Flavisolibacter sp.]
MKQFLTLVLFLITLASYGQDKFSYIHFNQLTEIKGTNYVMASMESLGKKFSGSSQFLLFINTATGQTKRVDFPKDAYLYKIEQVKIDSLGINKVIVMGNTVNLDNNKKIDWNDPSQIIVLSTDGEEKVQLTEDKFFVSTWAINNQTGTIIITGHYDSNNNGKYDKTDKNEILIFNLKTLKLVSRI